MQKWMMVGVGLALCLVSCEKKGNYRPTSQILRLNLHREPPTLDPRKATDVTSISVLKMCFEGLTRLNSEGQPIPAIAEKIEISPDQKRYTFTLRKAKWSDGTSITAQDFALSWKTILDPDFICEFANDLYVIKNAKAAKTQRCSLEEVGVKALDEKTLQVDLEHPAPYFLSALATHAFFPTPQHVLKTCSNWTEERYVGNGPFCLKEWRHHDAIFLEKNTYYWDLEHVSLEKIRLTLIDNEATELSMFENAEIDWAGFPLSNLPTDALASLDKKGLVERYPIAGTYYYVFNTKMFPFNNANIRKAFTLAINREAIVKNVTQMGQQVATSFVPPSLWKNAVAYFQDHDIKEAQRLFALGLKELGIAKEDFPEIKLSYNTLSSHHKIAQAIQQQWLEALGVRVKLENKEWKVFLDELRQHQFQVARLGGVANLNDPISFLDFYRYLSSSNNHSQWSHPKFSDLLEKADQTTDAEARLSFLKEAEKILMSEMPIAPIYFYTGAYLKKPYVKGVSLTELNAMDLKSAYLEIDGQISR